MEAIGKKVGFVLCATLGANGVAWATNGDQMLGVTATQWGMAGASTAAPQDAGTVLTNPAGLATLEFDEFRSDMGFGFLNPPRKANGVDSDSDLYLIPSGALAYRANDKLTFGMGMSGLSGMGVDFDDITPMPGNQNVVTTKQFYKIAPGFGYRINEQWTWGAALNIDYQSLAVDTSTLHLPQNQTFGFGATVGATYQPNDVMRFGLSYISEQDMNEFEWNATDGKYEMDMDAAQQLAFGAAFMPSDDLLIEADIKWIAFSDVLDSIDLSRDGQVVSTFNYGWDDQMVYAIGVQKKVNPKTTVRVGYNYGESPIGPEDVKANIGSLAVTEHHLSLGLTRELAKRLSGSLSYVHAFNNEITSEDGTTTIELEQNVVNLQISYRN
ncbi:OmpP1/FadL family transporter [Thiohalomonas denitrificans]|uniref:Long-chain fatty acid transport protein n=1 Tax=Thiohalomonas denitrificans TaxID=415747 RepID=A0A1G5Q640_9GAMM|nr:outer membrane protein transport protein [Thiohalomonas denitrificans]SCZ57334.1 long-chain fatty acid transport protein [Thiohalomonas denitrificans]